MENLFFQIGIFLILFAVGWGFGRHVEQKHLIALDQEEQRLSYIQLESNRFTPVEAFGQLVSSNVVISHDYFKYVVASIQNFLGGRLTSYETVVDRARREAVIRLKQEAERLGATQVLGLRLQTTEMGMQGGMVEVFAYGTAIIAPK